MCYVVNLKLMERWKLWITAIISNRVCGCVCMYVCVCVCVYMCVHVWVYVLYCLCLARRISVSTRAQVQSLSAINYQMDIYPYFKTKLHVENSLPPKSEFLLPNGLSKLGEQAHDRKGPTNRKKRCHQRCAVTHEIVVEVSNSVYLHFIC